MAGRRPSTNRRGPHLDLSAQDAAFRPATVKQKVKQWQGDGGGVVETRSPTIKSPATPGRVATWLPKQDTPPTKRETPKKFAESPMSPILPFISELSSSKPVQVIADPKTGAPVIISVKKEKRNSEKRKKVGPVTTTTYDPDRKAWVRKTVHRSHDQEDEEVRAATSPKKRVVSDGHWRKDKSELKPTAKKHETAPKRIAPQKSMPEMRAKKKASPVAGVWAVRKPTHERSKWTRLDPMMASPQSSFPTRTNHPETPTRQSRRISSVSVHEDVDTQPSPRRRQTSHRRTSRQTAKRTPPASIMDDDALSLATPNPDDSISRVDVPHSAPQRLSTARVGEAQNDSSRKPSGNAPLFPRNIFSKAQPAPKPNGGRIENWLGDTPDPFWEETSSVADETTRSLKSPVPEPLNLKKKRTSKHEMERRPLGTAVENRQFSFEEGDESVLTIGTKRSPRDKENEAIRKRSSRRQHKREDDGNDKLAGVGLGINLPRLFPTTGKALSTIASEITQDDGAPAAGLRASERPVNEASYSPSSISLTTIGGRPPVLKATHGQGTLQRSLTKHDDLMSVLSIPNDAPSLASARSRRSKRPPPKAGTIEDIMKELVEDESKYQVHLQTLVDGVVPLLLSSVLSRPTKSQSGTGADATRPIVDMGVALERLRTQHKRIVKTDSAAFLIWAQSVAKIYEDYVKAWKMGFDDSKLIVPRSDGLQRADKITRNANGVLVDSKGDKVDVAFLLKRPLVRVKSLSKTIKAIDLVRPSKDSEDLSDRWHALVVAARKKSNEEVARVEDEAAALIDATRARDPRSLAPLAGVRIDVTRSVRARDYFEMTLKHSTGQRLDCAVEVFIRDNDADPEKGGDILICEVSDAGRWLLFPPIIQDMVSARQGTGDRDLILMIRGVASDGSDWSELLTLHSSSTAAVQEWADMFDEGPVPPSPTHTEFVAVPVANEPQTPSSVPELLPPDLLQGPPSPTVTLPSARSERPTVTFKSRTPSPKEVEVPIGEQARKTSKRWSFNMGMATDLLNHATPGMFKKVSGSHPPGSMDNHRTDARRSSRDGRPLLTRTQRDALYSSPPMPSAPSPRSEWSESTISIRTPVRSPQPQSPTFAREDSELGSAVSNRSAEREYNVWMPSTSSRLSDEVSDDEDGQRDIPARSRSAERPVTRRTATTPSRDLPSIPKLRRTSPPQTPKPSLVRSEGSYTLSNISRDAPSSAPGKLQKVVTAFRMDKKSDTSPKTAAPTPAKQKTGLFSTPNFLKRNRRASSPLKREYAPSVHDVADDSKEIEQDLSDDESITSYDSEVDEKEDQLAIIEPPPLAPATVNEFPLATPPLSLASLSGPSLQPSNSASQGPYRATPHQPGAKVEKTVANIYSWSDRGVWDPLHPVEILVVVSPGMIEAFSMSEAYGVPAQIDGAEVSPSQHGVMPLVALELTPLVPLRRGTALDISIRSPPTAASKIKSSNNVMFRSRSPDECENLYNLINQARINNATYIALQNARPYTEGGTWAAQMDRRNQLRTSSNSSSWFGLGSRRGSTYRSNSVRKRHTSAMSDSSIGTMNTAFSALRRLSGAGLRSFSRSRIDESTNSDSLSSGCATPARTGSGDAMRLTAGGMAPDLALGMKEVKIRLYHRESASKWRDMGSARLTIMLPPTHPNTGLDPSRPSSPAPGPRSAPESKRRILVTGTTKGETLLDVTLGEGSFERVARTGIAVSVWRDNEGSHADSGRARDKGGVGASYMDVFMIQMKSERDAAYTFGLVGKLRY